MERCRELEEHKEVDPEVKRILDLTGGDEKKMEEAMKEYLSREPKEYTDPDDKSSTKPVRVSFREYDPASAYVRSPVLPAAQHDVLCGRASASARPCRLPQNLCGLRGLSCTSICAALQTMLHAVQL